MKFDNNINRRYCIILVMVLFILSINISYLYADNQNTATPRPWDTLMEVYSKKIMPNDMVIGSLFDSAKASALEIEAAEVVVLFLINPHQTNLYHPEWSFHIKRLLKPLVSKEIESFSGAYRIGNIAIDNGFANAEIRVIKKPGRTSGEIILERKNGKWKIVDFFIDFSELHMNYQFPYKPFNPASSGIIR